MFGIYIQLVVYQFTKIIGCIFVFDTGEKGKNLYICVTIITFLSLWWNKVHEHKRVVFIWLFLFETENVFSHRFLHCFL